MFHTVRRPSPVMHKGAFKKYVRSRFASFNPPPPCLSLLVFEHPPPPQKKKVRSFWLELTTLSPSIFVLVRFREKKLIMSTSIFDLTFLLRSHSGISIKWAPLVHDKSVRFMAGKSSRTPFIDRTEYYNLS